MIGRKQLGPRGSSMIGRKQLGPGGSSMIGRKHARLVSSLPQPKKGTSGHVLNCAQQHTTSTLDALNAWTNECCCLVLELTYECFRGGCLRCCCDLLPTQNVSSRLK
jgi:hypothetical protein